MRNCGTAMDGSIVDPDTVGRRLTPIVSSLPLVYTVIGRVPVSARDTVADGIIAGCGRGDGRVVCATGRHN